MKRVLLVAAMTMVLTGCPTTPDVQTPAAVETRPPVVTPTTPSATPTPRAIAPTAAPGMNPLKDPANILSKRSVFFDFDQDAVKPEFVPLVEAHAKYLRDNRGAKMLIQGNADERGSREYNLALGQRRSEALSKRLGLLGATGAQIESVSLGEEKPACVEHTEQCWARNRRGDMLYGGEY